MEKGGNKSIIKPDSILRELASSDIAIMKEEGQGEKGLVLDLLPLIQRMEFIG